MQKNTAGGLLPIDYTSVWLVSLLPFVFVFDYKGEEGGAMIQYLMAAAGVGLSVAVVFKLFARLSADVVAFIAFTAFVLILGVLSALMGHVPAGRILRVAFPYYIFLLSVIVGSLVALSPHLMRRLLQSLLVAGVVSSIFRFYYATGVQGVLISDARYQILSPALAFLLAYVMSAVSFTYRFPWRALLLALSIAFLIALSVTRVFLLVIALSGAVVLYTWFKLGLNNRLHASHVKWRMPILYIALGGAFGGFLLATVVRPDLISVWLSRIFEARSDVDGMDITYITRIAESRGIWDVITSSPLFFVFGRGFGATYGWSDMYAEHIRRVSLGMLQEFDGNWVASHIPFVYGLFFAGIFGFLWSIYVYWRPISLYFRLLGVLSRVADPLWLRDITCIFFTIIIFAIQSLTANPFGDRMATQILGLCIGLGLSLQSRMRNPKTQPLLANLMKVSSDRKFQK